MLNAFKFEMDTIEHAKKPVDFGKIFAEHTKDFEIKTYNYGKHIVE